MRNYIFDEMNEEERLDFLSEVMHSYNNCLILVKRVVELQRMEDEWLTDHVSMAGISPLVSIAFHETKFASLMEDTLVSSINRFFLEEIGKQFPKRSIFNKDPLWPLKQYEKYIVIKREYPNDYCQHIESELKTSFFYSYRGRLRPLFRKEGLLTEIKWITTKLFDEKANPITLNNYYFKLDGAMIYINGYPNA
ncbi:MAG: hypothetical protein V1681_05290 [Candidatus Neomarinimicrobiota bacterium]